MKREKEESQPANEATLPVAPGIGSVDAASGDNLGALETVELSQGAQALDTAQENGTNGVATASDTKYQEGQSAEIDKDAAEVEAVSDIWRRNKLSTHISYRIDLTPIAIRRLRSILAMIEHYRALASPTDLPRPIMIQHRDNQPPTLPWHMGMDGAQTMGLITICKIWISLHSTT